jgi:hypothetical protein
LCEVQHLPEFALSVKPDGLVFGGVRTGYVLLHVRSRQIEAGRDEGRIGIDRLLKFRHRLGIPTEFERGHAAIDQFFRVLRGQTGCDQAKDYGKAHQHLRYSRLDTATSAKSPAEGLFSNRKPRR